MTLRVLVVDDEVSIAVPLAKILSMNGYEAVARQSGEDAVLLAANFKPDLLITDFNMPGMNGIDLANRVVHDFPGCRVVVLTAFPNLENQLGMALGSHITVLTKPIGPDDLLRAIAMPALPVQAGRPVILNVDDVESHRYSVSRMLTHSGFEVIDAADGAEALEKISANPALVLLDVNLPDLNGFEVCRLIRAKNHSQIPIVHCTATYKNADGAARSNAAGANEYIEQPIEPRMLASRLREWIQLTKLNGSDEAQNPDLLPHEQ